MGQFYEEIPTFLVSWIHEQKMFWVATAPLSETAHVNVSPKGFEGTFHIASPTKVWYEDMSGSGVETIAHLRENGRITILFTAFEGPPRIARLFGTGTVHEFDTPEYNTLIPLDKRQPGSRSIIVINVHKVGSSCGYSIPFYSFKANRMTLHNMAARKEFEDVKAESCIKNDSRSGALVADTPPLPEKGLKSYWKTYNVKSIDGLPGLQDAFRSLTTFDEKTTRRDWDKDDESLQKPMPPAAPDLKILFGFALGVVMSGLYVKLTGDAGLKVNLW